MKRHATARGHRYSPNADQIDFHAITRAIETDFTMPATADAPPISTAIGSSELEDLAGDTMKLTALQSMCDFEPGKICFLNHAYDLPYAIWGTNADYPHVVLLGDTPESAFKGLQIKVKWNLQDGFPSTDLWKAYQRNPDMKIGVSIGCQVTGFDIKENEDDGEWTGLDIHKVKTLEFSSVGIPCNQDSYITPYATYAARGVLGKMFATTPMPKEAMALCQRLKISRFPTDGRPDDMAYIVRNWEPYDDFDRMMLSALNERLLDDRLCIASLDSRAAA